MNTFVRSAAVAGLLALSGVAAFGQSDLKADIPFAFTTPGGGHMPAGKYEIIRMTSSSAIPTYRLLNLATRRSTLALAPDTLHRGANGRAHMLFRCASGECAVAGVFPAGLSYGYGIPVRPNPAVPATDIAEIAIPLAE